jgi:hypothetical protein
MPALIRLGFVNDLFWPTVPLRRTGLKGRFPLVCCRT